MAPLEEIETAIANLEAIRSKSSQGRWSIDVDGILYGIVSEEQTVAFAGDLRVADNCLIVTLHRTIDAQMSLLKVGLVFTEADGGAGSKMVAELALGFARDINGTA